MTGDPVLTGLDLSAYVDFKAGLDPESSFSL
jgi:hypothetical protein